MFITKTCTVKHPRTERFKVHKDSTRNVLSPVLERLISVQTYPFISPGPNFLSVYHWRIKFKYIS